MITRLTVKKYKMEKAQMKKSAQVPPENAHSGPKKSEKMTGANRNSFVPVKRRSMDPVSKEYALQQQQPPPNESPEDKKKVRIVDGELPELEFYGATCPEKKLFLEKSEAETKKVYDHQLKSVDPNTDIITKTKKAEVESPHKEDIIDVLTTTSSMEMDAARKSHEEKPPNVSDNGKVIVPGPAQKFQVVFEEDENENLSSVRVADSDDFAIVEGMGNMSGLEDISSDENFDFESESCQVNEKEPDANITDHDKDDKLDHDEDSMPELDRFEVIGNEEHEEDVQNDAENISVHDEDDDDDLEDSDEEEQVQEFEDDGRKYWCKFCDLLWPSIPVLKKHMFYEHPRVDTRHLNNKNYCAFDLEVAKTCLCCPPLKTTHYYVSSDSEDDN